MSWHERLHSAAARVAQSCASHIDVGLESHKVVDIVQHGNQRLHFDAALALANCLDMESGPIPGVDEFLKNLVRRDSGPSKRPIPTQKPKPKRARGD